jgi:hypothetical protein
MIRIFDELCATGGGGRSHLQTRNMHYVWLPQTPHNAQLPAAKAVAASTIIYLRQGVGFGHDWRGIRGMQHCSSSSSSTEKALAACRQFVIASSEAVWGKKVACMLGGGGGMCIA